MLLLTDLHAGNVLSAGREPWLVIDPKPYLGDPAYDPLQHLLNCPGRLQADPAGLADRMAGLCERRPRAVPAAGCSRAAWSSPPGGPSWPPVAVALAP